MVIFFITLNLIINLYNGSGSQSGEGVNTLKEWNGTFCKVSTRLILLGFWEDNTESKFRKHTTNNILEKNWWWVTDEIIAKKKKRLKITDFFFHSLLARKWIDDNGDNKYKS